MKEKHEPDWVIHADGTQYHIEWKTQRLYRIEKQRWLEAELVAKQQAITYELKRLGLRRPSVPMSSPQIHRMPGFGLLRFTRWFFSKKHRQALEQVIADMQHEYVEALQENRPRKALWVRMRGIGCYLSHIGALLVLSPIKLILRLWTLSAP